MTVEKMNHVCTTVSTPTAGAQTAPMKRIELCVALFRMPGLGEVYEGVRAQLSKHIDMLAVYERHLNITTEIHVICDTYAWEDMQHMRSRKAINVWHKIKLYTHRDLPAWYPIGLMTAQLDKGNKTMACFTRYLIAAKKPNRDDVFIFVDANDMVTPTGAEALIAILSNTVQARTNSKFITWWNRLHGLGPNVCNRAMI